MSSVLKFYQTLRVLVHFSPSATLKQCWECHSPWFHEPQRGSDPTGGQGFLGVGPKIPGGKYPGMVQLDQFYGDRPTGIPKTVVPLHSDKPSRVLCSRFSRKAQVFQHLPVTQEKVKPRDIYCLCCIWLNMVDMGRSLGHARIFTSTGGWLLSSPRHSLMGKLQKCFLVCHSQW